MPARSLCLLPMPFCRFWSVPLAAAMTLPSGSIPRWKGRLVFSLCASFQQIYRELNRLEEKEWLQAESVQQENRPDKRIYTVTALGKQQLCQWIAESEEMAPIKDELLVKLYVGHLVPRQTMVAKLEAHRRQHPSAISDLSRN